MPRESLDARNDLPGREAQSSSFWQAAEWSTGRVGSAGTRSSPS